MFMRIVCGNFEFKAKRTVALVLDTTSEARMYTNQLRAVWWEQLFVDALWGEPPGNHQAFLF